MKRVVKWGGLLLACTLVASSACKDEQGSRTCLLVLPYRATPVLGGPAVTGQLVARQIARATRANGDPWATELPGVWEFVEDTGGLVTTVTEPTFTIDAVEGDGNQLMADGGYLHYFAFDLDGVSNCGGPQAQFHVSQLPDGSIVDYPDGHPSLPFPPFGEPYFTSSACDDYVLDIQPGASVSCGGAAVVLDAAMGASADASVDAAITVDAGTAADAFVPVCDVFSDDFEGSADPAWQFTTGNWEVIGGNRYHAGAPTSNPPAVSLVNGFDVTDFSLSVSVANGTQAGVFVRAQDDDNAVVLILDLSGMHWSLRETGTWGALGTTVPTPPLPGTFIVDIRVTGTTYNATLRNAGGAPVAALPATTYAGFASGTFGLYHESGTVTFDDFCVGQ